MFSSEFNDSNKKYFQEKDEGIFIFRNLEPSSFMKFLKIIEDFECTILLDKFEKYYCKLEYYQFCKKHLDSLRRRRLHFFNVNFRILKKSSIKL